MMTMSTLTSMGASILDEKKARNTESPEKTKKRLMRNLSRSCIKHETFQDALDFARFNLEQANSYNEPPSIIITGEAGVGKTFFAKQLSKCFGRPFQHTSGDGVRKIIPALYLSVPSPASIKSLAENIIYAMNLKTVKGSTPELTQRVKSLIRTCRVKVIILDEFHHLLAKGSEKSQDGVRNWLKDISNSTGTPIVLVGMPECIGLVDKDPQTARRYPIRIPFKAFQYDLSSESPYRRFLRSYYEKVEKETRIGFPKIHSKELATRLYAMTEGRPSSIMYLLNAVALFPAIIKGATVVEESALFSFGRYVSLPGSVLKPNVAQKMPITKVEAFCITASDLMLKR